MNLVGKTGGGEVSEEGGERGEGDGRERRGGSLPAALRLHSNRAVGHFHAMRTPQQLQWLCGWGGNFSDRPSSKIAERQPRCPGWLCWFPAAWALHNLVSGR